MVQPPSEIFLVPTLLRVPIWSGTETQLYDITMRKLSTFLSCLLQTMWFLLPDLEDFDLSNLLD